MTRHNNAPDLDAKPFPGESPETCKKVLFLRDDLRIRCVARGAHDLHWSIDHETGEHHEWTCR